MFRILVFWLLLWFSYTSVMTCISHIMCLQTWKVVHIFFFIYAHVEPVFKMPFFFFNLKKGISDSRVRVQHKLLSCGEKFNRKGGDKRNFFLGACMNTVKSKFSLRDKNDNSILFIFRLAKFSLYQGKSSCAYRPHKTLLRRTVLSPCGAHIIH